MSTFQPNHQWYAESAARVLGQVPKGEVRIMVTGDELADMLYGQPATALEEHRNTVRILKMSWSKP